VADFIRYPRGKVLVVFDRRADADRAIAAVRELKVLLTAIDQLEGRADADRLDAAGRQHA
jgi:hypothetical protein